MSVPSNIVEGCARRSKAEYLQFLNIAFASLRESIYQMDLAVRLGYLERCRCEELFEAGDHAARVLSRLISAMTDS